LWLVVGVLLALIILFEVGIRHVPPDGMTVTEVGYAGSAPFTLSYSYTAPKDQQTIGDIYAAFNRAPVWTAWTVHGCVMTQDPSSVVFTWHGVPVESWTLAGCVYDESAGGISDALFVQHLLPDITMPLPPPIEG
jgi:hypothetical protein